MRAEAQFLITVAALSMFAIPLLGALGRKVAGRARDKADAAPPRRADEGEFDALSDHVVIGGFGRVGRTVARLLDAEGHPYVALDLDGDLCAREREAGRPVYYGDASRKPMLEKVGGARARAFVVTSDDPEPRSARSARSAPPGRQPPCSPGRATAPMRDVSMRSASAPPCRRRSKAAFSSGPRC